MDIVKLTNIITKAMVMLVFWLVLLISLFLETEINTEVLLYDLIKAVVIAGLSWIFLGIIMDTLVKTIVASAKESQAERFDGGLIYHFIEPGEEEKAWQDMHKEEIAKEGDDKTAPSNKKQDNKKSNSKK
jgi:hypothetical protein